MCHTVYSIAVEKYLGLLVSKCQAKHEFAKLKKTNIDIHTFLASCRTLGDKSHCPLIDSCQRLCLHDIRHRISLGEKALSLAMLHNREIEGSLCELARESTNLVLA